MAASQLCSTHTAKLQLPPSCVEFSPLTPSCFLVGTYRLESPETSASDHPVQHNIDDESALITHTPEDLQSRNGSIVVFRIQNNNLTLVHTKTEAAAVLDLHFHPTNQDVVGIVTSAASFKTLSFRPEDANRQLTELDTVQLPGIGDEILFLSFCWHPTVASLLALTTSDGHVYLARLSGDTASQDVQYQCVITHGQEAWCAAISRPFGLAQQEAADPTGCQLFTLFSGGDDSMLRCIVCAVGGSPGSNNQSLPLHMTQLAEFRGHHAGVTAILPLHLLHGDSEIILTGSYDDHIRAWAIPPLAKASGRPKAELLTEYHLGGGVWRLKLIELRNDGRHDTWRATLLVSCMHAGVRVVELKRDGSQFVFSVLARFEEHQSMNYGSDVQPRSDGRKLLCVSTSFYDRLVCLWEVGIVN